VKLKKLMSSMTLILVVSGMLSACGDATPTSKSVAPTATTVSSTGPTGPTATTAANTPPRMAIGDFKALYDDPAKRPLIVDVRPVASYAEGHIGGSVSMPETDIDTLVTNNQVPKDKMIVAYCQ
jgi:Rhodanese-like domain